MGAVEIPLQDLSFSQPIKMRMYRVTIDKSLVHSDDEDAALLPPSNTREASAQGSAGREQRRVPWPDEPQEVVPDTSLELWPELWDDPNFGIDAANFGIGAPYTAQTTQQQQQPTTTTSDRNSCSSGQHQHEHPQMQQQQQQR